MKWYCVSGTVTWVGYAPKRFDAAVAFMKQCYPRIADMSQSITISERGHRQPGAPDSVTITFFELVALYRGFGE